MLSDLYVSDKWENNKAPCKDSECHKVAVERWFPSQAGVLYGSFLLAKIKLDFNITVSYC